MAKAHRRVKAFGAIVRGMGTPEPDRLAAALRDNLRRRKVRMRDAQAGEAAIDSFGSDEEGDVPPAIGDDRDGAWVKAEPKRD